MIFEKKDNKLAKQALEKIAESEFKSKQKQAMSALVNKSKFSYLYSSWILSEDKEAFKVDLEHNKEFYEQANNVDINLDTYSKPYSSKLINIKVKPGDEKDIEIFHAYDQIKNIKSRVDETINSYLEIVKELKQTIEMPTEVIQCIRTDFPLYKKINQDESKSIGTTTNELLCSIDETESIISYVHDIINKLPKEEDAFLDIIRDKIGYDLEMSSEDTYYSMISQLNNTDLKDLIYNLKGYTQDEKNSLNVHNNKKTPNREQLKKDVLKLFKEEYSKQKNIMSKSKKVWDNIQEAYHLSQNLDNDFNSEFETIEEAKELVERISKLKEINYFVKLEDKTIEDVLVGNDGGCCKGIYRNEINENNQDLPFLFLDEGTKIFGIYRQLGEQKPRRTGIILSFTTTNEQGEVYLAINSTELSKVHNPLSKRMMTILVDQVHEEIKQYAKDCGFKGVTMGTHSFNTSINYASKKPRELTKETEFIKLPETHHPNFYQEIFHKTKIGNERFYEATFRDNIGFLE